MLPAALEVGNNSAGKLTLSIIAKLNIWLKSSFLDASPTMPPVAMWPIGSLIRNCDPTMSHVPAQKTMCGVSPLNIVGSPA